MRPNSNHIQAPDFSMLIDDEISNSPEWIQQVPREKREGWGYNYCFIPPFLFLMHVISLLLITASQANIITINCQAVIKHNMYVINFDSDFNLNIVVKQ